MKIDCYTEYYRSDLYILRQMSAMQSISLSSLAVVVFY